MGRLCLTGLDNLVRSGFKSSFQPPDYKRGLSISDSAYLLCPGGASFLSSPMKDEGGGSEKEPFRGDCLRTHSTTACRYVRTGYAGFGTTRSEGIKLVYGCKPSASEAKSYCKFPFFLVKKKSKGRAKLSPTEEPALVREID